MGVASVSRPYWGCWAEKTTPAETAAVGTIWMSAEPETVTMPSPGSASKVHWSWARPSGPTAAMLQDIGSPAPLKVSNAASDTEITRFWICSIGTGFPLESSG